MHYIDLLWRHNIPPNFWCSKEYFEKAGWVVEEDCGGLGGSRVVFPSQDDHTAMMVPPLHLQSGLFGWPDAFPPEMWSDFEVAWRPETWNHVFREPLDLEYIYNPWSFSEMSGKEWAVFRKNSRKFPRRHEEFLVYESWEEWDASKDYKERQLEALMVDWLGGKPEEEVIQDSGVMLKYLAEGENRRVLRDAKHQLLAVNIFDSNYKYVNFRYCVCRQIPFLSEYARWAFYTSLEIQMHNKMVNDGGVLDNPHLKAFKDKMNPRKRRQVYSYRKEGVAQ